MAPWTKIRPLLLLCTLAGLAGCLHEDTITVTKNGLVSFEAIVTETDEQKKMDFPAFETLITNGLADLRKHKWKVEESWTSKQRPYHLTVTGSGKLAEVTGSTAFYALVKASDTAYKFTLLPPGPGSTARVVFKSVEGSAAIIDAAGKPVHEIESVSAAETFTIVLR